MKKSHVFIALGVLVAALVAFYLFWPKSAGPVTAQQRSAAGPATALPTPVPGATGDAAGSAGGAAADTPLWWKDPVKASKPQASQQSEQKRRDTQAAFENIQRLLSNKDGDPAKLAAALAQVEKANGSPIYNGIRLDAVRQNLELSKKMMVIGEEIRALTDARSKNGAVSPSTETALKAKQAQLEALSKQMNTDVLVQPLPAFAPPK